MKLKELIGLHLIKRIAVFRDEDGIEDAVHFTMAGTRHRAVRVDFGRDGQRHGRNRRLPPVPNRLPPRKHPQQPQGARLR